MYDAFEPTIKEIYVRSHSRKTAGYKKFKFQQMISKSRAIFAPTVGSHKIFVHIEDNEILFDSGIYPTVLDYFIDTYKDGRKKSKQYYKELKHWTEKYPEYFI